MDDKYEWDEAKRLANIAKHKIDFEAVNIFEWNTATRRRVESGGEVRLVATGYIHDRLYVVVYTMRGDRRRIISARRANARERRRYEQEVGP